MLVQDPHWNQCGSETLFSRQNDDQDHNSTYVPYQAKKIFIWWPNHCNDTTATSSSSENNQINKIKPIQLIHKNRYRNIGIYYINAHGNNSFLLLLMRSFWLCSPLRWVRILHIEVSAANLCGYLCRVLLGLNVMVKSDRHSNFIYAVQNHAVLRIRIRHPVPFWSLDPRWVKSQDPDPGWTPRIIFPRA